MMVARSVADLVRGRAGAHPTDVAYTFLQSGDGEQTKLTWADVDRRSRAIGAWLSSAVAVNGRAVLLFQPGLEFVEAFFGCLYAAVVAVPAYGLHPDRLERTLSRLRTMMHDAMPDVVLTDRSSWELVHKLPGLTRDLGKARWITTAHIPDVSGDSWQPLQTGSDEVVVLQYTSGSVSAPKGVMLTNRNVLANEATIQEAHGYDETSTLVGWVPLAHDWGLINGVLQPAYSGARAVLMAPEAFLQKPARWLRAISRYENVASGGPNFAYDLCLQKVAREECRDLDLSTWKCAGVSAGPVRAATLERFAERFAPYGFHRDAFYCGYGLAEATLLVCDTERGRFPRTLDASTCALQERGEVAAASDDEPISRFVSCGRPPSTARVAIVDPQTLRERPPGNVGEIWISGDNIAVGYWNNPDATRTHLRGRLPNGDEGPFLRTGDLGFFHEGELFVTGRLKDLIIIRGRNIHPQDIESSVERCHPSLRLGCTIAFAFDGSGEEQLVIVQEVRDRARDDLDAAIGAIRRVVMGDHDVVPYAVVLIEPAGLPKTSSGKLQRGACRGAYLAGTLPTIKEHILERTRV
jgi:acyl-CoA synthetase (AMP-forming)/AMP-acid ligase II